MTRIISIGEAMVEIGLPYDGGTRLHYGGDCLNTAIHLARRGQDVAFFSSIGQDPLSARVLPEWEAEGLDCSLVRIHPEKQIGLYAISTDECGERSFAYWRENSAAREMLDGGWRDDELQQFSQADLIYFSLITLAILPDGARETLFSLCKHLRDCGKQIAFDSNYRPALWPDRQAARDACLRAMRCADFGFPTLDDEQALFGPSTADQALARWQEAGCCETILKMGKDGCLIAEQGKETPERIAPVDTIRPLDTSGAGDGFNAGYLDARLKGGCVVESAYSGHELATWVIRRVGAIPQQEL